MNKLIITKYVRKADKREGILTALSENGVIAELNFEETDEENILGNIYIGKVKNIVKNIRAAFVEIAPDLLCYYSFEDNKHPVIVSQKKAGHELVEGDELLVQVSKEGIKTKAPVVTSNLNFSGKYAVLTSGNRRVGISAKIPARRRKELKELAESFSSDSYGFVIRTNAAAAENEQISEEIRQLIRQYEKLVDTAAYRTCHSCLLQRPKAYLEQIKNAYAENLAAIVTDDRELHQEIFSYLQTFQEADLEKLVMYEDEKFPMHKLYSLETAVDAALKEQVWLKSGAYLVIQNTEAFTVIDVNTGKYSGKKDNQETFLRTNLEAAKEIARQIRLRNLSGIIIVDFIDLKKKDARQKLMEELAVYLAKDSIPAKLVGMTKLNLVEITRKKTKRPLKEQLTFPCPACKGSGFR